MDASPHHPEPRTAGSASALLEELAHSFPEQKVSVGALLDKLDARANGVVLLVLALPMCIPNVPGISTIFGLLMLGPALQLVFGMHRLWVPKQLREASVEVSTLKRTFAAAIPTLRRIEYLIKPRLSLLTQFPFTIYVGLQTLLLALVLILPIPGGNWPPGITVALTALALLQRDGVLLLLTTLAAAISTYLAANIGIAVLHRVMEWLQHATAGAPS